MLDEEYCYKAINFDLDTKAMQQYKVILIPRGG